MNIKAAQEIRNAPQNEKLTLMVELICGKGSSERSGIVFEVERALHDFERYLFSVSPGYHMTVISPSSGRKPVRKVIITEEDFDQVIQKERESNCHVYGFLRDYLGLDGKPPLSPEELAMKYPCTAKSGGEVDMGWYDEITRIILKGVKRQVFGPGKKAF